MTDFTGDRITFHFNSLNISRKELIRKLGITPSALSKWERNKEIPKSQNLKLLSAELKVSTDYLLLISDFPYDPKDPNFIRIMRTYCKLDSAGQQKLASQAEQISATHKNSRRKDNVY